LRVFLDTNVLVSAVATRGVCADVLTVVLAEHELVVGEAVLAELSRILSSKMKLPPHIVEEADAFLRQEGTVTSAQSNADLSVIRDEDDRKVMAEAIAGGAEVLVTGDRDLLDVASQLELEVVSPRGFWEKLHRRQ
jgi:putative PIN family toxin of toxin-antitoxin system